MKGTIEAGTVVKYDWVVKDPHPQTHHHPDPTQAGAGGAARQAAQAQCGQLVRALDLSDARVAQMVSNFTASRAEIFTDDETAGLRAFQWLSLRWHLITSSSIVYHRRAPRIPVPLA